MDETLGEWIDSSSSELGKLWACSNCLLNHTKKNVEFLKEHPDCSFEEFKNVQ